METIWIIGGGRFGREAVLRLRESERARRLVLVENDRGKLSELAALVDVATCAEGVEFVVRELTEQGGPDWVVPAVPVHLAAEWCLRKLPSDGWRKGEVPPPIREILPNPMVGATGDVYVSHATFRCPAGCEEPPDRCTVTQQPRKEDMFTLLAKLVAPPFRSLVLRSYQLGPGVGGVRPVQLFDLLDRVRAGGDHILLSTACRCHGVVTNLHRS